MIVKILYFGHLVDLFGKASEHLELPPHVASIGLLAQWLSLRGKTWADVLTRNPQLKITVNKQFAEPDTPIKDGDEIAFVAFQVA
jgi:molybdopterin synthase sulfur carrier subunit